MMHSKKLTVSFFLSITIAIVYSLLFTINTGWAFGISPSKTTLNLNPGETKEIELTLNNQETTSFALQLEEALITLKEGKAQYYESDTEQVSEPSYSLRPYLEVQTNKTQLLNPGDKESVIIKVSAPEDIDPGTYLGAYFISKTKVESELEEGTAGAEIKGRIAFTITANIGMEDAKEELTLDTFEINEEKLDSGILELYAEFTNKGDFSSTPTGSITFYQADTNEQVKDILRETQTVGNEIITKGFKDKILFNKKQTGVYPGDTSVITTTNEDKDYIINLTPGKYYAQLEAFYGMNEEALQAKTDIFEIKEIVYFDSFNANKSSVFDKNITFKGNVVNNGQSTIDLGGNIYIKNIFGQNIDIINLQQQRVLAGETYEIQQDWFAEKGLGLYFVTTSLKFNDTALEKTIQFYHFDTVQIIIALVVIIVLIVILTLAIKNYLKLKKKADEKKE